MKYLKIILVALLFSIPITAQELIMIYSGGGTTGGTAPLDTIPSQFTFTDVTDAALSSYNQAYIVVAGCDSARFYPASGDSLKLGALGTYDVSPIWADLGDSVYTGLIASGTNETATHSIIYSSNGTPYDTFSVTTVASGGVREALNPSLNLVYSSGVTASGSNTVTSWTDGTFTFTDSDTSATKVVKSDTSLIFAGSGNLSLAGATSGNPFNIGTDDFSIEIWVYEPASRGFNTILYRDNLITLMSNEMSLASIMYIDSSAVNVLDANINDNGDGVITSTLWHHIVFVWDRNVGAYLYVDGSVIRTETTTEWTASNGRNLTDGNTNATELTADFVGEMKLFATYPTALSSTDVTNLHNLGAP